MPTVAMPAKARARLLEKANSQAEQILFALDASDRRKPLEKKAPFPWRRPAGTAALRARRVLTFERVDRGIARRDEQLIGIPTAEEIGFVSSRR